MRAVDICVHGRKAVGKTLGHETLRRQVITLLEIVLAEDVEDARVTLEIRRMQRYAVQQVTDATEPRLGRLERHAPHESMDLISQSQQILGQITSILPGDPRDERPLRHTPFLMSVVSASDITRIRVAVHGE